MTQPHDAYVHYLETLTPESLKDLSCFVIDDVHFKDPFNDVQGAEKMKAVFAHMFDSLGSVKFEIHHAFSDHNICLLNWQFTSTLRGAPWQFDGASKVTFDANGKVSAHIDYWDAGREFYERLPVVGWPLRRIRHAIAID